MVPDAEQVARRLGLPFEKVQRTIELLDSGNSVPFITRYRKDQTGGLDEEQIRRIQVTTTRLRMLAERKATILKSIQSQGKLTDELARLIDEADSPRRLEDLYLPYKPKKQTLATIARQRGLEPLAREILEADKAALDLAARAGDFISPDNQLHNLAEVMEGVGHLLAERFSENAELRGRLRDLVWRKGMLACTGIEAAVPSAKPQAVVSTEVETQTTDAAAEGAAPDAEPQAVVSTEVETQTTDADAEPQANALTDAEPQAVVSTEVETQTTDAAAQEAAPNAEPQVVVSTEVETQTTDAAAQEAAPDAEPQAVVPTEVETQTTDAAAQGVAPDAKPQTKASKRDAKRKKLLHAFRDYLNYREPLSRIPPHRILAINRGQRASALRVRIEIDSEMLFDEATRMLVPPDHPHADFLRTCVRDMLSRLAISALEREVRRELTEQAEDHAVEVFARNLRKLLLQPPLRSRRVLAIDPGFKSGCKLAALDEFGNVLAHEIIHIVGNPQRQRHARERIAELVRRHELRVMAIGNGTGCRQAEHLSADVIASELADRDVAYVIVNEAGASVYSTSPLGREELPQCDAALRSAVSIGRRLQDPLSELVKINAANIGVGLYQHDLKARHLRESLDAVVESCVNYVGVEVNTASPALLGYVSGLNQLTARRMYEYRQQNGPFKNREQLKEVPGIGEATFVQAAGFLKISDGDNPLDTTWIHPESYDVARRLLESLEISVTDLIPIPTPAPVSAVAATVAPASAEPPREGAPAEPPPPAEVADGSADASSASTSPDAADSPAGPSLNASHDTPAPAPATEHSAPATEHSAPAALSSAPPGPAPADAADGRPAARQPSAAMAQRLAGVDVGEQARKLGIGTLLLRDLLHALSRPGRDPRDDLPAPVLRRAVLKLEDLKPGMELTGTVRNVVDFGAFVDIGLSDCGLVHISRMANRYVRDLHEIVSVGDVMRVWVVDVDKQRRRVSLTAIDPSTPQEPPRRPARESRGSARPPRAAATAAAATVSAAAAATDGRPAQREARPAGQKGPHYRSGGGRRGQAQRGPRTHSRPSKPRPVTPISKEMEEGTAPLRSFSDLMQFWAKKHAPEDKKENGS